MNTTQQTGPIVIRPQMQLSTRSTAWSAITSPNNVAGRPMGAHEESLTELSGGRVNRAALTPSSRDGTEWIWTAYGLSWTLPGAQSAQGEAPRPTSQKLFHHQQKEAVLRAWWNGQRTQVRINRENSGAKLQGLYKSVTEAELLLAQHLGERHEPWRRPSRRARLTPALGPTEQSAALALICSAVLEHRRRTAEGLRGQWWTVGAERTFEVWAGTTLILGQARGRPGHRREQIKRPRATSWDQTTWRGRGPHPVPGGFAWVTDSHLSIHLDVLRPAPLPVPWIGLGDMLRVDPKTQPIIKVERR